MVCAAEALPGRLNRVVMAWLGATQVAFSQAKVGRFGELASDS